METSKTSKKTIMLFSDDFDKVMVALMVASAAAAMGDDVTIFCTFWGLNVLRRTDKAPATKDSKKSFLQSALCRMMPKGIRNLRPSKMNFAGVGAPLMRKAIRDAGGMSLEELFESAREQGVKFVACTLSMGILGLRQQELVDGVELAGMATYLAEADESNVNLFV